MQELKECDAQVVEKELERILGSKHFRAASRCCQFLSYVVQAQLAGRDDLLKERTIGTEIFRRDPGYATGDDPVVRVQAGEVRKRLDRFYHDVGQSEIRIELPLGSYAPNFVTSTQTAIEPLVSTQNPSRPSSDVGQRSYWPIVLAAAIGAIFTAVFFWTVGSRRPSRFGEQMGAVQAFWAPVGSTRQPTLICLPKPVVYRPQNSFYDHYAKSHPGEFRSQLDRLNLPIQLPPDATIRWGDLEVDEDLGVGPGDVQAAVRVAALLARLDVPTQLRTGHDYSFGDLRNSPAVMIGGYSSRWTLKLTANLKYAFVERNGISVIQERGPKGRSWTGQPDRDYGIVARLLAPETGQFVVVVAGITSNGSDAAAKFVSTDESIKKATSSLPSNWPQKNLEVVVETEINDGVPGPPHAVAVDAW